MGLSQVRLSVEGCYSRFNRFKFFCPSKSHYPHRHFAKFPMSLAIISILDFDCMRECLDECTDHALGYPLMGVSYW